MPYAPSALTGPRGPRRQLTIASSPTTPASRMLMAMSGPVTVPLGLVGGRKPGSFNVGSDSDGRASADAEARGLPLGWTAPSGRAGGAPMPPPVGSKTYQP